MCAINMDILILLCNYSNQYLSNTFLSMRKLASAAKEQMSLCVIGEQFYGADSNSNVEDRCSEGGRGDTHRELP